MRLSVFIMISDISDKLEILVPATELILGHRLISRVSVTRGNEHYHCIIVLLSSLLSLLVEVAGVGRALDLGRYGRSEGAGGEALPVKTLQ